eukprot:scaffold1131_cov161-Amphora_coffeaeformis.AAC.5
MKSGWFQLLVILASLCYASCFTTSSDTSLGFGLKNADFSPAVFSSTHARSALCPLSVKSKVAGKTDKHHLASSTALSVALLSYDLDLPSLLTAFDTFDGSAVVDPVVVSDVFWSSLATKILSLVLGQILATIVFSVVISIAASQLSGVMDRVSKGIVERLFGPPPPKLRMPPGSTGKPQQIDLQKLAICLAIDVLGTSSELLPIVGELTDVIYAPIAATLLRNLYGGSNVVFLLEFSEEILPFTDILPLATICWVVDTFAPESGLARLLQLGSYRPGGQVIDTTSRVLGSGKDGDDRSFR